LAREESDLAEKVLLAFFYYGDLLKLVFKHSEQKTAQRRVKKLIFGNEEGSKLGETLDEIMTIACKSE
jgi:hypothetical protein